MEKYKYRLECKDHFWNYETYEQAKKALEKFSSCSKNFIIVPINEDTFKLTEIQNQEGQLH